MLNSKILDYLDAFPAQPPTFEIELPDGSSIECSRHKSFGDKALARKEFTTWKEFVCEEFAQVLAGGEASLEGFADSVRELGRMPTEEELLAAFHVKHYSKTPKIGDALAVKLINRAELLDAMYQQITTHLIAGTVLASAEAVEALGKD